MSHQWERDLADALEALACWGWARHAERSFRRGAGRVEAAPDRPWRHVLLAGLELSLGQTDSPIAALLAVRHRLAGNAKAGCDLLLAFGLLRQRDTTCAAEYLGSSANSSPMLAAPAAALRARWFECAWSPEAAMNYLLAEFPQGDGCRQPWILRLLSALHESASDLAASRRCLELLTLAGDADVARWAHARLGVSLARGSGLSRLDEWRVLGQHVSHATADRRVLESLFYRNAGRWDEAVSLLKAALRSNSPNALLDPHFVMADLMASQGRHKLALSHLGRTGAALATVHPAQVARSRAVSLQALGSVGRAAKELHALDGRDDDPCATQTLLGDIHMSADQPRLALRCYARAMRKATQSEEDRVVLRLARAWMATGATERAARALRAITSRPWSALRGEALLSLGLLLADADDLEPASLALRMAAEENVLQYRVTALTNLGATLWRQGHRARAKACYAVASRRLHWMDGVHALYNLAMAAEEEGDPSATSLYARAAYAYEALGQAGDASDARRMARKTARRPDAPGASRRGEMGRP